MTHKPIGGSAPFTTPVAGARLPGGDSASPLVPSLPQTGHPSDTFCGPQHERSPALIAAPSARAHPVFRHIATTRHSIMEREDRELAPYAAKSSASHGQIDYNEPPDPHRTVYMRDRDRIVHSRHFRRLGGVRQVAYPHDNTYKRTRLTHTTEVAQIARSLARTLRLNEDLTEAIALGHDLGHPPFGHDGEEALNAMMQRFGLRFEHNVHSYRILRHLARYNPQHRGLNPSMELLYGIALHRSPYDDPPTDAVDIPLPGQPPLEGQLVNIADVIAYIAHDTDDALQAHLPGVGIDRLRELRIVGTIMADVERAHGNLPDHYARHRIKRELIDRMVAAALNGSAQRIAQQRPASPSNVYTSPTPLIAFSDAMQRDADELRTFLYHGVYKQGILLERAHIGREVVERLFTRFLEDPALLQLEPEALRHMRDRQLAVAVCDTIAALTDVEAQSLYESVLRSGHAA